MARMEQAETQEVSGEIIMHMISFDPGGLDKPTRCWYNLMFHVVFIIIIVIVVVMLVPWPKLLDGSRPFVVSTWYTFGLNLELCCRRVFGDRL